MYEKTIEKLQDLRDVCVPGGNGQEALDAAIELMHAAEPKDEAQEREHCYTAMEEAPNWADHTSDQRRDWLMRDHAQARAEGFAAGRQSAGDDWREVHHDTVNALETKLGAAHAELARLQAKVADDALTIGTLKDSLAAAKAEIERLNTERDRRAALIIKLLEQLAAPLPAWDQSDGVVCGTCGDDATLCSCTPVAP